MVFTTALGLQLFFKPVLLNRIYTTIPTIAQMIVMIIACCASLVNMNARPMMAMIDVMG